MFVLTPIVCLTNHKIVTCVRFCELWNLFSDSFVLHPHFKYTNCCQCEKRQSDVILLGTHMNTKKVFFISRHLVISMWLSLYSQVSFNQFRSTFLHNFNRRPSHCPQSYTPRVCCQRWKIQIKIAPTISAQFSISDNVKCMLSPVCENAAIKKLYITHTSTKIMYFWPSWYQACCFTPKIRAWRRKTTLYL